MVSLPRARSSRAWAGAPDRERASSARAAPRGIRRGYADPTLVSPFGPLALTTRASRRYDPTPTSVRRREPPEALLTAITNDAVSVGDERTEEFPPLTRTMFVRYAGAS